MKKFRFVHLILLIIIASGLVGAFNLFMVRVKQKFDSDTVLRNTWRAYKKLFIDDSGRVTRPKDKDTVSEAQAYAMLRAVWMDDKEVFNRCYSWTEENLSRFKEKGDHLLAWHWQEGKVSDWMPASDADIDYALSLIFAAALWGKTAPDKATDYVLKAQQVLDDILRWHTFTTGSGRLYLAPWILNEQENPYPLNPSYYSPAHFRIFLEFSKDVRWQQLIDTTYYMLNSLNEKFSGTNGVGLFPDWCSVTDDDQFLAVDERGSRFGWDALRVPLRVSLDYFWFRNSQAKQVLTSKLVKFLEQQWQTHQAIFSVYGYDGTAVDRSEDAAFYAAYYCVLRVGNSVYAENVLAKTRLALKGLFSYWVYKDKRDYYVNSLAWVAEGIKAQKIRNIFQKR